MHISISPTLTNKLRVLQNHLQQQATIELQNTTIEMEAGLASLAKLKDKNLGEMNTVYTVYTDTDKASSCGYGKWSVF